MDRKFLKLCQSRLKKLRNKYSNRVKRTINYQHSAEETERVHAEQYIHSSLFFRREADKIINEIDHALIKINKGIYGLCERTGRYIEPKRLIAVPYARFCNRMDTEN